MTRIKNIAKRYGRIPSEDDVYEVEFSLPLGASCGYFFRVNEDGGVEFVETDKSGGVEDHEDLLQEAAEALIRNKGIDTVFDDTGEIVAQYVWGDEYGNVTDES